jgi:hypothetical protein
MPSLPNLTKPHDSKVLKNAEQEKKRAYNDRIIEVENGTFIRHWYLGQMEQWVMNARNSIKIRP